MVNFFPPRVTFSVSGSIRYPTHAVHPWGLPPLFLGQRVGGIFFVALATPRGSMLPQIAIGVVPPLPPLFSVSGCPGLFGRKKNAGHIA